MATIDDMRTLALAQPHAEEKPHFDRASFRVKNKIFATLSNVDGSAVVKLSLADQTALVESRPDTFFLVGWSQQGWTGIALDKMASAELGALLKTAWRNVAPPKLVATLEHD